ncbi:hypothetical protein pdul_cds_533 [Pandoravirus dulcis]|uniref:Uncharacterized protein n=1 Tax=Pandoravirus dulcis TaxID=1349409 RepID=A0A291AU63_9VIRU|nr:hypothetical protein pdul_cds_533 [Pandoravirus dulcis]ATE82524.1 hypothetical protein pdul_cds_533 [Pandoravirus dulcis]
MANHPPLGCVVARVEIADPNVSWDDMALHYSPDVDAIVIHLTPAEYVIDQTFGLEGPSTTFLDVDAAGKGVHIEFLDASDVFACHFYDHDGDVDGRGPLDWRVRCKSDRLMLSFVADADRRAVAASDMEEGVTMHTDDSGRIVALSIADASSVVHRRLRAHL